MTVHVDGTVADLSSLMAIAIAFLPLLPPLFQFLTRSPAKSTDNSDHNDTP